MHDESSSTTIPPEPMIAPASRNDSIIDRRVHQAGGHAAAGRPADLHRLDPPPFRRAAADVFDDLAQGRPHRHFDQSAAANSSGQGEHLGAFAFGRAEGREFLRPMTNNPRHQRQRFDVVDQGRFAPKARLGGKRRSQPRHPAPAFHRGDQGRLFAADERPGALDDAQAQCESRRPSVSRPASRAFPIPQSPPARAGPPADIRGGCRKYPRARRRPPPPAPAPR